MNPDSLSPPNGDDGDKKAELLSRLRFFRKVQVIEGSKWDVIDQIIPIEEPW